jgi:hypothetical protein
LAATVRASGRPRVIRYGRPRNRGDTRWRGIRTFNLLSADSTMPGGYRISGCHPCRVVRRPCRAQDGGRLEEYPRGALCPRISITM